MNERPIIYNPPYIKIEPPINANCIFIFQDVDCMLLFGTQIEIEELFGLKKIKKGKVSPKR